MKMTEAEELLLDGLKLFPMQKGNMILVMFLMETDAQRWELIEFLANTQNASENEIMSMARQIAKQQ